MQLFSGAKAFGNTAKTHWGWAVILVVVLVLFVAAPLKALLMRVPGADRIPGVQ